MNVSRRTGGVRSIEERSSKPVERAAADQAVRERNEMAQKAFPHRIMIRLDGSRYGRLKEESMSHGYQVAVVQRWLLLPRSVDDLYPGSLDGDADTLMRRPMPSGSATGRREGRPCRNVYLTEAEYELVTRAAMRRGVLRSVYVGRCIEEQIDMADNMGWPLPEGITNESVDAEARRMLLELEERGQRDNGQQQPYGPAAGRSTDRAVRQSDDRSADQSHDRSHD